MLSNRGEFRAASGGKGTPGSGGQPDLRVANFLTDLFTEREREIEMNNWLKVIDKRKLVKGIGKRV